MKGRNPTVAEQRHMDAVRDIGCIVCKNEYDEFNAAAIHHIDGKTKPWAHFNVLPLCPGHHQHGGESGTFISVHPWKKRFEAAYGTEKYLKQLVEQYLPDGLLKELRK